MFFHFFLITLMYKVFADDSLITVTPDITYANVSIDAFLDDLNYIRLNISLENIQGDIDIVSIRFMNSEECNPINDIERFSLKSNSFIIIPSMELERPADHLINGCKYEIRIEDDYQPTKIQTLVYEVPECVENKCRCRDSRNSPYQIEKITSVSDGMFNIQWKKVSQESMTVSDIYYQRENDTLRTFIPETHIILKKDAVDVPLPDLREGVFYRVTVKFVDEYNECTYFSSMSITVDEPGKGIATYLLAGLALFIVVTLSVLLVVLRYSEKLRNKLRRYMSCFGFDWNHQHYLTRTMSFTNLRKELSAQYTPLEFVTKSHKFDDYEFPRNKVILKEVIGEGAFGRVFFGKAFEIQGNPGYTMVAVKQLREGAPPEEAEDFRNEIVTLKRIGNHPNIVSLFGCVTMDQPFMMIMELVPCGCLKKYLWSLRRKWTMMRNGGFFFPDDVIIENRKQNETSKSECSYIQPEYMYAAPTRTNDHENSHNPFARIPSDLRFLKPINTFNQRKRLSSEGTQVPHSPSSVTSGRLPSCTDTETTSLDSEPLTPSINDFNRVIEPVLDPTELQQFAFQIANGMKHLEKINVTHRDLAARNVLITGDKTLKISDFGMSRTGSYVTLKGKKLPLRWMAIEAIEERRCDSKSDVWSFGVVLWEIGTLGAFPYKSTPDVMVLHSLKMGKRLERPGICTDELYSLMLKCWSEKPEDRPSFQELVESLDANKRKVYVDFSQVSPKYVFPSAKEVCEIPEEL